MKRKFGRYWLVVICIMALPLAALAQDDVTDGDLKVGHGQVNWTERTITATGSGAPDLKAPNVAVARLGAERVAKMDALRNILETLKGVQLNSEVTVENEMVTNSKMRSKIQGVVRRFKVLKTKYYSDGGVDLIVQMSLDGPLGKTLIQDAGKKADSVPAKGEAKNTGLVIDARGFKAKPALSPKVLDEKGEVVYSSEYLGEEALDTLGVVGYFKDIDSAKKNKRVGANPLVIKAKGLSKDSKTDLVISNQEASNFKSADANVKYLVDGKVIIVID
jgi:hypothetical protein